HIRAWLIQLLCENDVPRTETLVKLTALAENDPSPVVRLYLAASLQRLPHDSRWPIAAALARHAEDAADANLPLMIWYGIEPLVAADRGARAQGLLANARIPIVRQYIARRLAAADWDSPVLWGVLGTAQDVDLHRDVLRC